MKLMKLNVDVESADVVTMSVMIADCVATRQEYNETVAAVKAYICNVEEEGFKDSIALYGKPFFQNRLDKLAAELDRKRRKLKQFREDLGD